MILTSMTLMSLVAVGCANEEVKDTQDNQPVISTNMEEVQTEGNANTKKPLIVYFSYGEIVNCYKMQMLQLVLVYKNGMMKILAIQVQQHILFKRKQKHENNIRPELANHIANLDDYDTIFVGYPNWWYDMPMAMYSFFDEYDLSNKTIIPFNTSGGSAFSDTINTIKKLEPNANVIEGITIRAEDVESSQNEINEWLNDLGYNI